MIENNIHERGHGALDGGLVTPKLHWVGCLFIPIPVSQQLLERVMALSHRYATLKDAHARLEGELYNERSRPFPDPTQIQHLKRRKLKIKDEIAAIEQTIALMGHGHEAAEVRPRA